jgi:hypothetical protein
MKFQQLQHRPISSNLTRALTLAALVICVTGCQTVLSSKVKGSKKPRTETCTPGVRAEVQNGDFTIIQKCVSADNLIVGDGISEMTVWEFEVSEKDLAECYPETAYIDMKLRPTGHLMGEALRVQGRWAMGLEQIQSLEVGVEQPIQIDMMTRNGRPSPYTPGEVRRLLLEDPTASLPMLYELNAIVYYAELTIHCRK